MKPRHSSNQATIARDLDRTDRAPASRLSGVKPSDSSKAGWKEVLCRAKDDLKKHNLSMIAAGVAFYVFLGLIPALGALISIWGLVAEPVTIQQQVKSMSGLLPQDVVQILNDQLTRIANQPTGATLGAIIGALLAIWSGAKAMKAVMIALNISYEEEETRGFFRLNLTAIALTLAGIVGFLLALGTIVALPLVLDRIGLDSTAAALVKIVRWPLLALFAILGLGILYRYGPDHQSPRGRWISWGAVFATFAWLAISAGFSFYVANFGNYNKTYGSLGAVVVFLMWFLISAYMVLFGAELNAELEKQTERNTTTGPDQPRGQRFARASDTLGETRGN